MVGSVGKITNNVFLAVHLSLKSSTRQNDTSPVQVTGARVYT